MRLAVSVIALLMVGVLAAPSEAHHFWHKVWQAVCDLFHHDGDGQKSKSTPPEEQASKRERRSAVEDISDAREEWRSKVSGRGGEDTKADQEANAWGRNGGDPDRYRP
ncbi:uncharacterized protein [Asterias amurensis]|uniref:uncharacterized protein n=1 Tax=Asterias amurensis TaxID=7602 RepID=UPI003AB5EB1D